MQRPPERSLRFWLDEARAVGLTDAPCAVVPAPTAAAAAVEPEPKRGLEGLLAVERWMGNCRRCALCEQRQTMVYGEGDPDAELMFIGEGPGAEEDRSGRPFVGPAGALLTRMIEQGIKRPRSSVFIANMIKCRPPGNRRPEGDEIAACLPFLKAQIEAVSPRVIVLLGGTALKGFHPEAPGITRCRGQWLEVMGRAAMPTFHPAYLLRCPEAKREAWMDLKQVMERLGWS